MLWYFHLCIAVYSEIYARVQIAQFISTSCANKYNKHMRISSLQFLIEVACYAAVEGR